MSNGLQNHDWLHFIVENMSTFMCVCTGKSEETWFGPIFAVAIWSNIKKDQIASPSTGLRWWGPKCVNAHTVASVGPRIQQDSDKPQIEKWHNESDCDSDCRARGIICTAERTMSSAFSVFTLTTSIIKLLWLQEVTWHPALMVPLNIHPSGSCDLRLHLLKLMPSKKKREKEKSFSSRYTQLTHLSAWTDNRMMGSVKVGWPL